MAKDFVEERVAMVLGDNIVVDNLQKSFEEFEKSDSGAKVYLKEVDQPTRYGVATVEGDRIKKIVEKPDSPDSKLAVAGIYLYEKDVFDKIEQIEPSDRGELEITDEMFDQSYKALRNGGELYLVYNQNMRFEEKLSKMFSETETLEKADNYLVLKATK